MTPDDMTPDDDLPMIDRLREDIDAIIGRYRSTACLTYVEIIGAMEVMKLDLVREMQDESDDARGA